MNVDYAINHAKHARMINHVKVVVREVIFLDFASLVLVNALNVKKDMSLMLKYKSIA